MLTYVTRPVSETYMQQSAEHDQRCKDILGSKSQLAVVGTDPAVHVIIKTPGPVNNDPASAATPTAVK